MAYELHWTEEQIRKVKKDYSSDVVERLRKVLNHKDMQISSVQNPAALGKRFHNTFTLEGLKVAEIQFSIHGKEFRAICVVLHDIQTVIYHTLTDKNNQERTLRKMRRKSDEISDIIRAKVSQERP